jgi:outer membrane protein assembly factor BamB
MSLHRLLSLVLVLPFLACSIDVAFATDWTRFRGENGSGVSNDDAPTPAEWSDTKNLKWKVDLPGPGLSSPIIVGDKIFVTSWTGYAAGPDSSNDQKDLKRVLVCLDRTTGNTVWSKSVDAVLPEDEFQGMFAQNGYASHTPVSDGKRVVAFYGKSGVVCYDMQGTELWKREVGEGRDPRSWGSASSPIIYGNLVIVTAAAESESLIGLDLATGDEKWRQEAGTLSGTWSTPILVKVDEERTDLVIAVPGEIWGINPETGKLRWFVEAGGGDSACASVVADGQVVCMLGGRGGGSIAVRAGGKGDVRQSHVVWQGNDSSRIGTPVIYQNRMYWVSDGVANCVNTETGKNVYKKRLQGGGAQRGRGGDYSSPVVADGKLYYVSRGGTAYVLKLGDEFEQLATNRFESEEGEFSASPAVADGEIYIRSTTRLYCVANTEGEE